MLLRQVKSPMIHSRILATTSQDDTVSESNICQVTSTSPVPMLRYEVIDAAKQSVTRRLMQFVPMVRRAQSPPVMFPSLQVPDESPLSIMEYEPPPKDFQPIQVETVFDEEEVDSKPAALPTPIRPKSPPITTQISTFACYQASCNSECSASCYQARTRSGTCYSKSACPVL